jgi:hypothetical protein
MPLAFTTLAAHPLAQLRGTRLEEKDFNAAGRRLDPRHPSLDGRPLWIPAIPLQRSMECSGVVVEAGLQVRPG